MDSSNVVKAAKEVVAYWRKLDDYGLKSVRVIMPIEVRTVDEARMATYAIEADGHRTTLSFEDLLLTYVYLEWYAVNKGKDCRLSITLDRDDELGLLQEIANTCLVEFV